MSYPFCFGFASTILDHHQNAFTAQEELVKTLFPNPTETEGVESRAWSAKYVIPLTCVWTAPFRVPPDLDPPPPLAAYNVCCRMTTAATTYRKMRVPQANGPHFVDDVLSGPSWIHPKSYKYVATEEQGDRRS